MKDFTSGNATKQIVAFAVPMLIGNVFQQVYSMADAMVVGRFVGGNALAAVGTSSYVLNFLLAVLIGLTTGASVVISQFYGARQEENLARTVSTSLLFLVALALVISVGGYLGAPYFLRLLNVPGDIFAETTGYLQILMAGMLFPILYNMYTAYLRALGEARRPLYILIFACLVNVILDIVFVVYLGLGVAGAAYATIIAQTLAALLCWLYASRFVPVLRIRKLVFDLEIFKTVLRYSIPAAVQLSLTTLANLTIMRLVNSFGSSTVAGYTAATKIDQFAMMPLNNISMAVSTFVGQNMGAGLEKRARDGFRSAMLFTLGVGVFVSAVALLFGKGLIALFVDRGDPNWVEIVGIGTQYLSIIAVFYILFAVFFAFNGFFRGAGDAVIVMILTITSLTIRALCAHFFVSAFSMGPEAVAWSIPIGWGLCSLFALFYYKKRLWAGKVAVKQEDGAAVSD